MDISIQYLEGTPARAGISPANARGRLRDAFERLNFREVLLGWDLDLAASLYGPRVQGTPTHIHAIRNILVVGKLSGEKRLAARTSNLQQRHIYRTRGPTASAAALNSNVGWHLAW